MSETEAKVETTEYSEEIFAGMAAKVRMRSGQEEMEDTLQDPSPSKRTKGKVSEDLFRPYLLYKFVSSPSSNDNIWATCVSYPGIKPGHSANIYS